jgi:fructose-1,6-bisphosphatase/inositol monophosphatase family enzyme
MKTPDLDRVGAIMSEVAAAEALPRWRNLAEGDIIEKAGPDDVVTVADRAVEVELSRRLVDVLPGSVVVGEEAVHANPGLLDLLQSDGAVWIIDPIDGTSAFAAGSPDFAVMVGLSAGRELIAGWILGPVTGELTAGGRGMGVWQSTGGALMRLTPPSPPSRIAELRGAIGRRRTDPLRAAHIAAQAHRFASMEPAICAGIEYPRLITGGIHFSLYNKSEPWDHLPGLAMAEELGFHYARHDGTPYRPGDNTGGLLVAPDRARWNEIKSLLLD